MSVEQRFAEQTMPIPFAGCLIWTGCLSKLGYAVFKKKTPTRQTVVLAHREIYRAFRGEIPPGLCVLHKCDTPSCVNPDHLFIGTKGDNNRDREAKGRSNTARGENHSQAKLTIENVKAIRADVLTPVAVLASRYGVAPSQISCVRLRRTWKSVQ